MRIGEVCQIGLGHKGKRWRHLTQQPPTWRTSYSALIFKNNAGSFSTPGNSIYVGSATGSPSAADRDAGTVTEVNTSTEDANYVRQQVTAAN